MTQPVLTYPRVDRQPWTECLAARHIKVSRAVFPQGTSRTQVGHVYSIYITTRTHLPHRTRRGSPTLYFVCTHQKEYKNLVQGECLLCRCFSNLLAFHSESQSSPYQSVGPLYSINTAAQKRTTKEDESRMRTKGLPLPHTMWDRPEKGENGPYIGREKREGKKKDHAVCFGRQAGRKRKEKKAKGRNKRIQHNIDCSCGLLL